MHIAHHPIFIALASLTAWLGAWTALDVFRRVRAHVGGWRLAWLDRDGGGDGPEHLVDAFHRDARLQSRRRSALRRRPHRPFAAARDRDDRVRILLRPRRRRASRNHGRRGDGRRHLHDALRRHVRSHHRRHARQRADLRGAVVRGRSHRVDERAVRREERDDVAAACARGRGARVRDRRHALHGDVWCPRVAGAGVERRIGRRGFAGAGNRSRRRHACSSCCSRSSPLSPIAGSSRQR